MTEVIVLFDGYSTEIDEVTMKANCSCTLIKGPKLIIVDTMTAWDRTKLLDALNRENVAPSNIDYVVCTHSHADHIGNNNLFTNAIHIIGTCVENGDIFYEKKIKEVEYQLCEGVKIVSTPGHTADDVTVLIECKTRESSYRYAITGDLFEKEEDIQNPSIWKALGTTELQKVQSKMSSYIINLANFIVPGHGPKFSVTDSMRQIVQSQIIK